MQNRQSCSLDNTFTCPSFNQKSYTSKNPKPNPNATRTPNRNIATIPENNILCINPCITEEADSIRIPFSLANASVINLLIDTGSQITI